MPRRRHKPEEIVDLLTAHLDNVRLLALLGN